MALFRKLPFGLKLDDGDGSASSSVRASHVKHRVHALADGNVSTSPRMRIPRLGPHISMADIGAVAPGKARHNGTSGYLYRAT
jgi:hypothetical protein